jgi:predicted glycogen debranching enzyme
LRADLYPILKDIVAWHMRGTRYGIRVDARDALLYSGEAGVQLTWMDAKVVDWVVTPRTGKCVEINALWYNVLNIMQALAEQESDSAAMRDYAEWGRRVAISFNRRFWFDGGNYLYDGMEAHLRDACIGQISEIFDGDAPFQAPGCFAQAWSVAQILRSWGELP